jgi:hypothetical protein
MRRYDLLPMEGNELPAPSAEHTFVGRERELSHGLAVLDDAVAGLGRLRYGVRSRALSNW